MQKFSSQNPILYWERKIKDSRRDGPNFILNTTCLVSNFNTMNLKRTKVCVLDWYLHSGDLYRICSFYHESLPLKKARPQGCSVLTQYAAWPYNSSLINIIHHILIQFSYSPWEWVTGQISGLEIYSVKETLKYQNSWFHSLSRPWTNWVIQL